LGISHDFIFKIMNWQQFLKVAYPDDLRKEDSEKRTAFFRYHRRIGLYLGYLFYHLGITANFIGISRIFIALFSLFLISLAIQGNILLPFIGIFLLYGQHILDQTDGVVARAAGTVNKLGAILDGIANSFSRYAILILLAAFTGNLPFLLLAVLVAHLSGSIRAKFIMNKIAYDTEFKGFATFFRVVFSIQAMLFILPVSIVLINLLNWSLISFSYITVSFYAVITFFWSLLSFYKNKS
jgi:phosphatidylglycerophosphate synthase